MAYTYWLPNEQGNKQEYSTINNAVIIVGANGAGKSKLGAWIEQQDLANVHRIGAQRNLNFSESIQLQCYTDAENFVYYGTTDENTIKNSNKGCRWDWGKAYTTKLHDDFGNVLAALLALNNNDIKTFFDMCRTAEQENKAKPTTPRTVLDKLTQIWDTVLPQRKLIVNDSRFFASFTNNGVEKTYSANQMSDGERAVLYLAAQVLCVPPNKTLIIDEPEVHLHRSIMLRLWNALERCRPDCLFIYITHDTQFAAMHYNADKIWIKKYDGENWNLEKVTEDDLPEELLLDILGSRKNVLFVEGERNSYDTMLYTELYENYHIIPCGSCTQVIARTKAFRNNPSLHDCEVFGIIDRDYRTEYEINKYKDDHIYTINVAEVENLFIVEELIRFFASHIAKDPDTIFNDVKQYVINERFAKQINGQICEATVAQIKYMLLCADISKKDDTYAKDSLDAVIKAIDYDTIRNETEQKFKAILTQADYLEVIRVFNCKNISASIGRFFGIDNKEYRQVLIGLLHGDNRKTIIDALARYLPPEIPR